MNRRLLITTGIILLFLTLGGTWMLHSHSFALPPALTLTGGNEPYSDDPTAQVRRITTVLLLRRIEDVRNHIVTLQHREEGRQLLELWERKEE